MATAQLLALLRHLVSDRKTDGSDRQLLERFVAQADEVAFAGLVERHGRLVFQLCRSVLHHEQDAEDAFQATFLVLARLASSIRKRDSLASWLHGVALRTALKVRRAMTTRRRIEPQASIPTQQEPVSEAALREVQTILHEEIARLPEKYRTPFVLCCLEGKSWTEAAQQLGWKDGTVSGRIAQARVLLGERLARRGVALSAALAAAALLPDLATACVPKVVNAAVAFAAGRVSETVSPFAATLAQGVIQAMLVTKLKKITAVALLFAFVLSSGGWLTYAAWQSEERHPASQQTQPAKGKPPEENKPVEPVEPSLVGLPRVLDFEGYRVDPFIRAAIALQKMGKEKACKKLLELSDDERHLSVFVLCRMLFTKKAVGEFAWPLIGEPVFLGGTGFTDWPLGPIEIVEGVPFFIMRYPSMGRVGESPQSAKEYLQYCIKHCDWSDFIFTGKGPNAKQAALDKLLALPKWKTPLSDKEKEFLAAQIKATARAELLAGEPELPPLAVKRLGSIKWQFASQEVPAAYSADGTWLVTYDDTFDNVHVRFLDPASGRELRSFETVHSRIQAFALARTANTIAVSCADKIYIWDAATCKPIRSFQGFIHTSACASADGKILAGVGGLTLPRPSDPEPKLIQPKMPEYFGCVWDATTGQPLKPFAGGIKGAMSMDLAPDGKTLAWRQGNGDLHVVNVADGKERFHFKAGPLPDKKDPDNPNFVILQPALAFSPDGKLLAFGTKDGLMVVDVATGKKETKFSSKNPLETGYLWKIAFAPTGGIVIACSDADYPTFWVWDVATGKVKSKFTAPRAAFAIAPDGKTLAFSRDQTIAFLDTATGKFRTEPGRYPGMFGCLSPDGKTAATISGDSKIRLWDTTTGKVRHTFALEIGYPDGLAFSPDGATLIGALCKLFFWDVQTGKEKKRALPDVSDTAGGSAMALSPDGNTVAAGGNYEGVIKLLDLKSGKVEYLKGCKGKVLSVAFSGDGKRLAAGTGDGDEGDPNHRMDRAVYLWDLTTRKIVRRMDAYKQYVNAVAISPDGKLVCSGAAFWDADSGKELLRLAGSGVTVSKLAFSPDGKTLALATGGYHPMPDTMGRIHLFDIKTMKAFRVLEGHVRVISSLTFAADSQTLLSTSGDGSALVWNLAKAER